MIDQRLAARDAEIARLEAKLEECRGVIDSLQKTMGELREQIRKGAYLKTALVRVEDAYQRQRDLTATWHAKYALVKHENNKLRRKLEKRDE